MPWRNGKLILVNGRQRTWAILSDPVDELLRNRVIHGTGLIVFNACAVVDQPCREQVGIAVIQIVKQLADILAHRHFQLHAEIVGELLRQFIVQTIFLPLITE